MVSKKTNKSLYASICVKSMTLKCIFGLYKTRGTHRVPQDFVVVRLVFNHFEDFDLVLVNTQNKIAPRIA